MDKKAQGLSISTIIIAIIVLVVLVVLVMIFTGYFSGFSQNIAEQDVKACPVAQQFDGISCPSGQNLIPALNVPAGKVCCTPAST